MSKFKFFQLESNTPTTKKIEVAMEIRFIAIQFFDVPFHYDELNGLTPVEAYEKLLNDFPGQNESIVQNPLDGLEYIQDIRFEDFYFYAERILDDNGNLTITDLGIYE